MKVEIFKAKWNGESIEPAYVGYIEMDEFNKHKCWEICNFTAMDVSQPTNLHSKIGSCSTDVIFYDPEGKEFHIPSGFGWNKADTLEEAVEFWKKEIGTVPAAKALYEFFEREGLKFEDVFGPERSKNAIYEGKNIIWCHWDIIKFLNEKDLDENEIIGVADYRKTKNGRNAIVDFMIYIKHTDNKFEVDIFTSDTDKDNYKFDDFFDMIEFVDNLSWEHPEYKERPTRLFVNNNLIE